MFIVKFEEQQLLFNCVPACILRIDVKKINFFIQSNKHYNYESYYIFQLKRFYKFYFRIVPTFHTHITVGIVENFH